MRRLAIWTAMSAVIALSSCSAEPPKCSDPETLGLIRQIILNKIGGDHPAAKLSKKDLEGVLRIQTPRAASYDEKIKKYTCEATLVTPIGVGDLFYQANINFESQLDDKREHIVALGGLAMGDYMAISQALLNYIGNMKRPNDKAASAAAQTGEKRQETPTAVATPPPPPAARTTPASIPSPRPEEDVSTVEKSGVCKGLDLVVTADMRECTDRKFTIADAALTSRYKEVMAGLNDQQKSTLRDKQRAWIKEKEAKCPNAGAAEKGGTLEGVVVANCYLTMTEERVRFLEGYRP